MTRSPAPPRAAVSVLFGSAVHLGGRMQRSGNQSAATTPRRAATTRVATRAQRGAATSSGACDRRGAAAGPRQRDLDQADAGGPAPRPTSSTSSPAAAAAGDAEPHGGRAPALGAIELDIRSAVRSAAPAAGRRRAAWRRRSRRRQSSCTSDSARSTGSRNQPRSTASFSSGCSRGRRSLASSRPLGRLARGHWDGPLPARYHGSRAPAGWTWSDPAARETRLHTRANGTGGELVERWATAHGAATVDVVASAIGAAGA